MIAYSLFVLGIFSGSIIVPVIIACGSYHHSKDAERIQAAYEATSFMKR